MSWYTTHAARSTLVGPAILAIVTILLSLPARGSPALQAGEPSQDDQVFAQALQSYSQNRFTDARTQFEQVHGRHSDDSARYISKIKAYLEAMSVAETQMRRPEDERELDTLDLAIQEYEQAIKIKADGPGNPTDRLAKANELKRELLERYARERSHPLPPRTAPAQPSNQQNTVDAAQILYERNDFRRARSMLGKLSAEDRAAADELLKKITAYETAMTTAEAANRQSRYSEARSAYQQAASIKSDGPGNPQQQAAMVGLAEAIDEFYSGKYATAQEHLNVFLQETSDKSALAHFYLGASKLARFMAEGEKDAMLREQAFEDWRAAKAAHFRVKADDISPRILNAYEQLSF